MAEVISRRIEEYEKHKDEETVFGRLPDLILLDGGKGQVSSASAVLSAKGYDYIPLFGMVKDNHHRTRAITDEGKEIAIQSKRSAFTLVSKIQDEVHRFAIGYHRSRHSKRSFSSSLTEIEGIGETRAKALLSAFRTISRIKQADIEELMQVKGINRPAAEAVYSYFHGENVNVEYKADE